MRTQWRTQADREAEQDVLKALDQFEAKKSMRDLSPPMTQREHQARDKIEDALIHAREVAETWDQKSLGLLKEGRDLLREEYRTTARSPLHQQDLNHCDKALQTIERDRRQNRDITRHGHTFSYQPDAAGTPVYVLNDRSGDQIVVIFQEEHDKAFLNTRAAGSDKWDQSFPHSLDDALKRGAEHADRYYEKYGPADARFDEYIAEQTLADRDPEKLKEQTKEQTTETFADRVKARIHKIKEQRAAQQQNRDQDRERD